MFAIQLVEDGDLQVGALLTMIAVILSIIVGLGGLAATIWSIARVKGTQQSIEVLNDANTGLREANADLRAEMLVSNNECSERVARLEGQIQALTDGLGQRLAEAIAARLEPSLALVAQRIVDGVAQRSADRERKFKEE